MWFLFSHEIPSVCPISVCTPFTRLPAGWAIILRSSFLLHPISHRVLWFYSFALLYIYQSFRLKSSSFLSPSTWQICPQFSYLTKYLLHLGSILKCKCNICTIMVSSTDSISKSSKEHSEMLKNMTHFFHFYSQIKFIYPQCFQYSRSFATSLLLEKLFLSWNHTFTFAPSLILTSEMGIWILVKVPVT